MVAGVAQVRTTIVVKGNDQASKSINKAGKSVNRLGNSLKAAQTRASAFGSTVTQAMSGNLSGAVSSLSTAIGGAGTGLVGAMGAATVGAAALGAAVAAGAVAFTNWSVEINRLKAGLDAALGPNGVEKAIAISNALGGVSAESIGQVATRLKLAGVNAEFTSEQLQELTARATIAGKTGDEALQALAAAIEKGNTRALKLVGTFVESSKVFDDYAKSVGKTTTQLTAYDKQAAVVAALQKNLNKDIAQGNAAHDRQDKVLSRLSNTWLRFKVLLSDTVGGPAADITESFADIAEQIVNLTDVGIKLVKLAFRPLVTHVEALITAQLGLVDVTSELVRGDLSGAYEAASRAARELERIVVDDNVAAVRALGSSVDSVLNPAMKRAVSASLQVGSNLLAGAMTLQRTLSNFAAPALDKAKELFNKARGMVVGAIFKPDKPDKPKARAEPSAATLAREAESAALIETITKEMAAEEEAKNAKIQNLLDVADIQSQVSAKIKKIKEAEANADKARTKAMVMSAATTAIAIGKSAASQIESERTRAGFMALIATAEAAMAFYRQDYAGGALATWAAINYARAALSPSPAMSGGGAPATGTTATGSPATAAGDTGGGGGPTNINVVFQGGFVIGTAQQVGRAAAKALDSMQGTGFESAGAV